MEKVAAIYLDAKDAYLNVGLGSQPNITHVATECGVGSHFVVKVEGELLDKGRVVAPKNNCPNRSGTTET